MVCSVVRCWKCRACWPLPLVHLLKETSRYKLRLETKLLINDLLPFWWVGFFKRKEVGCKGKETPGEEVKAIEFDRKTCDPLKAFSTQFPRISPLFN